MNLNLPNSRYPYKFSKFSSHGQILKMLSADKRETLLDLGCGDGTLSLAIKHLGLDVTGIELDNADSVIARSKGLRVRTASVSNILEIFHGETFDIVLAADILEHLPNPEKVLLDVSTLLQDKESFLLVSIPNVANIVIRLQLLLGKFEYTERGILDRTHLRFYTRKSLLGVLRKSSYEVLEIRYTSIPIELLFGQKEHWKIVKILQFLAYLVARISPTLFAYQFVVKVNKINV